MMGIGKKAFEYIVVGCGGIGSVTVYWFFRGAGSEVLGLEQFHLGHDRGHRAGIIPAAEHPTPSLRSLAILRMPHLTWRAI